MNWNRRARTVLAIADIRKGIRSLRQVVDEEKSYRESIPDNQADGEESRISVMIDAINSMEHDCESIIEKIN